MELNQNNLFQTQKYLQMAKRQQQPTEPIEIGGIPLSEENYLDLRRLYNKAVEIESDNLVFHGKEMVTSFAKYVLEEMETHPIIKPLIPDDDET
jgi:hypothetical protein